MNKLELLQMLTKQAKAFRNDAEYFARNSHMHPLKERPAQEVLDSVLSGFVNYVAMQQGLDWALYAVDMGSDQ